MLFLLLLLSPDIFLFAIDSIGSNFSQPCCIQNSHRTPVVSDWDTPNAFYYSYYRFDKVQWWKYWSSQYCKDGCCYHLVESRMYALSNLEKMLQRLVRLYIPMKLLMWPWAQSLPFCHLFPSPVTTPTHCVIDEDTLRVRDLENQMLDYDGIKTLL